MTGKAMFSTKHFEFLEARVGIEPTHKGFADLSLTTWVPRLGLKTPLFAGPESINPRRGEGQQRADYMERETGVEPATSTLERSHSTTELLPLSRINVIITC